MSTYLAIRDGGKTNEEGATRLLNKLAGTQNTGIVGASDLLVTQNGTPNMTVNIATGDAVLPINGYFYHGWNDASISKTITTADPSNPRIDRVVAYIDLAVVSSASSNNPNAFLTKVVAGTPAGSPSRPSDVAVQASVGSGNPWINLADVRVEAAVTSILTAKITDTRGLFQLGGGVGGIQFTIGGTLVVANNQTPYWIAPKAGVMTNIYAIVKTAPTGAALNIRINKNGVSAATFSISATSTTGNSTGLSITFAAGDYFSIDITQIGSTIAGADLTVAVG